MPFAHRRLVLLSVAALAAILSVFLLWPRPIPEPAQPVRVLWMFEPPRRGAIISAPVVADDAVFVAAIRDTAFTPSGTVYALDRQTGRPRWQFDDDGGMLHTASTPCLADGRLYFGEGMHANPVCKLYCLDAVTGRKLWHFRADGHIESSPCVADGRVFFGTGDDGLYCLDAVTGEKRWQFAGPYHIDSSPAVARGGVYAGSGVSRTRSTTEAFCLDACDGSVRWRTPTDLPVWAGPLVDGDDVFLGLGNGRLMQPAPLPEKPAGALVCLAADTGAVRWRHDTDDAVFARPTADDHFVYFGARDGACRCLDRRDGRLRWRTEMGSPVMTTSVLCDGGVYVVASAGRVCRLDAATGAVEWTFDAAVQAQSRARLYSSPVVVASSATRRIYFGAELQGPVSSAAVLYCLGDGWEEP